MHYIEQSNNILYWWGCTSIIQFSVVELSFIEFFFCCCWVLLLVWPPNPHKLVQITLAKTPCTQLNLKSNSLTFTISGCVSSGAVTSGWHRIKVWGVGNHRRHQCSPFVVLGHEYAHKICLEAACRGPTVTSAQQIQHQVAGYCTGLEELVEFKPILHHWCWRARKGERCLLLQCCERWQSQTSQ